VADQRGQVNGTVAIAACQQNAALLLVESMTVT
jgi:hypothetical protein